MIFVEDHDQSLRINRLRLPLEALARDPLYEMFGQLPEVYKSGAPCTVLTPYVEPGTYVGGPVALPITHDRVIAEFEDAGIEIAVRLSVIASQPGNTSIPAHMFMRTNPHDLDYKFLEDSFFPLITLCTQRCPMLALEITLSKRPTPRRLVLARETESFSFDKKAGLRNLKLRD